MIILGGTTEKSVMRERNNILGMSHCEFPLIWQMRIEHTVIKDTYLPTAAASTLKSWNGNYSMQHCISSLMQSPEKGCAESKSETIAGHTYHRQLIVNWPLAIPHPPDVRSSHPPSSDICNSNLKSWRKGAILGSSTVYLLSKTKINLCEYFRMMTAEVFTFSQLCAILHVI